MNKKILVLGVVILPLFASGCFFSPKSKELYSQMGPDKVLRFSIPLKDGVPDGVVKSYTTKGDVFSEQTYVKGIKEGAGHFTSENKAAGDSFEYTYTAGLLNGPIIHKRQGQEISRELYTNGLPSDWANNYKNPFPAKAPGTLIDLKAEFKISKKIFCGWINYIEEAVQSDTIEISPEADHFKASRLFSEAFTFEPNVFDTDAAAAPDANQFTHFHFVKGIFQDREGEFNIRLFTQAQKIQAQGYGYLKKKAVPVTEDVLKQDDSHLINLFGLKYDADLVDRSGFQKVELTCNHEEIQDRTDYSHDDEEE